VFAKIVPKNIISIIFDKIFHVRKLTYIIHIIFLTQRRKVENAKNAKIVWLKKKNCVLC